MLASRSLILCRCSVYSEFFLFKQKAAYEMRISDWSSDVCSSDLRGRRAPAASDGGADPASGDFRVQEQFGGREMAWNASDAARILAAQEIGRASCRERVCQYV